MRKNKSKKLLLNGKHAGAFFLCLTMGCSLLQGMSVAAYEQQSSEAGQASLSNVVASRGGMPVMGEVKPLVVKVAFPDYPFEGEQPEESVYTDEKLLRLFNGASDGSQTEDANSLGGYYQASSYGQLNIRCEDIYEYTALYERACYSGDGQYSAMSHEQDNGQDNGQCHEQYSGQAADPETENNSLDEVTQNLDVVTQDLIEETETIGETIVQGTPYMNSIEALYDVERPEYQLLDEMLEALDDEIDYRDYDSDGDGYIDAIYLNFSGPSGEWGSTWWPHVDVRRNSAQFDGVQYKAYSMIHNHGDGEYEEKQDLLVLIHETGHLLGLPDYYSYTGENSNMLGTFDIMTSVEEGDHNGFSKWTYGWLTDDDIQYIDRESGETTVHLTNLDADRKDGKMIAVIAPEHAKENGIYSRYFLVEYDAGTNLNRDIFENYSLTPGFRIFAVNAILEEMTGNDYQKNDNYDISDRLIYDVRQVSFYGVDDTLYREGDRFAPDTRPSSRFYSDYSKIGTPTGIVITDFVTGDEPSFHVSFTEAEDEEYEVEFTGKTQGLSNTLNMKLYSSMPLDIVDYQKLNEAYLLDEEGNHYVVNISEDAQEACAYQIMYFLSDPLLEPDTSYTLVIPENTFRVTESQTLKEVRIPVTTGHFEEVELLHRTPLNEWHEFKSDWVKAGDNAIVSLVGDASVGDMVFNVKLRKADIDGNEEEIQGLQLPIVAERDEVSDDYLYTDAELFTFEDGTMAVELYYLERLTYYHLDKDGSLIGEPQVAPVSHYDLAFTTGHYIKGAFYDRWTDSTIIFSIDFENPPVMMESESFVHNMCGMGNGEYATVSWTGDYFALFLYNGVDELTKEIPIREPYYALTYSDNAFYYLDYNIYLGKMDRDGNILQEKNIQQIAEPLLTIWDSNLFGIQKCDGRLMVSGIFEAGYERIRYTGFFDEKMNPLGCREFYQQEENVILLKDGVFDVREDITADFERSFWFYRLFYTDNSREDPPHTDDPGQTDDPDRREDADRKNDRNQRDDAGSSEDADRNNNQGHRDGSDHEKASRQTVPAVSDATDHSSPKTGDEWPTVMLLLMGSAALTLIAVRKRKNV